MVTAGGSIDEALRRAIRDEVAVVTSTFVPGPEVREKLANLDLVLDTLFGPELPDAKGGGRDTKEGIEHKVDYLYQKASNGGIPAKSSSKEKIIVAAIAAAASILGAYLAFLTALASGVAGVGP